MTLTPAEAALARATRWGNEAHALRARGRDASVAERKAIYWLQRYRRLAGLPVPR